MVYAVAVTVKTVHAQNPGRTAQRFDHFLTMADFSFWNWTNPNGSLSTSGPNPYFDYYMFDTLLGYTCERRSGPDKPTGGINPDRLKSGSSATSLPYLWYHPDAGTGYFLRTAIAQRFEVERHLINLNPTLQYQDNDTVQFDGFMSHNGASGRNTLRGRNAHDADASSPVFARHSALYGTDSAVNCVVLDSLGHPGVFGDSLWSQGFWSTSLNDQAPHWHRTDDFGHRSVGLRFRVRIDDTDYHHTSDTVFSLRFVVYDTASVTFDTTMVALSSNSGFGYSPNYFDTVIFRFLRPWTVTKSYVTLSWPGTHKITVDWMEALTTRIDTANFHYGSYPDGNNMSVYMGLESPDSIHYNDLLSYESLTANHDTILKVWIDTMIHRYKGYCQFIETREEPSLASMTTLKRAIKLLRDRSGDSMEIVCSMHDSLDANTGYGGVTHISTYGDGFYGLGLPDAPSYFLEGVRLGWLDPNNYADPKFFWTGFGVQSYRVCMPKRTIQEGDDLYKWEALYANNGIDTSGHYGYTRDSAGRPDEPGIFYDRDRYLGHIDFRARENLMRLRMWKRMCDRNAAIGQRFFINMEFDSPVDSIYHKAVGGPTRLATGAEMRLCANLCASVGASGLYWWQYGSPFGLLGQHQDYDSNWRWVKIGSHDSVRWFDAHKEHVDVVKSMMPSVQRYGDTLLKAKYIGDWTAAEALFVTTAPFQDSIHSLDDSGRIDRLDTARDTIRIHRFPNKIDTSLHITYQNVSDSSAVNRTLVHISEWIAAGGLSDTLLYITNMRTDDSYVIDSTTHPGTIDSVLGTFDRRYITVKMKAAHLITDVADTAALRIMGKVRTPYVGEGDSLVVWLLPGEGVLVRLTAPPDSMKQMRIALNYPKIAPADTSNKYDHGQVKFSEYVVGVSKTGGYDSLTIPSSLYSYVGIKDWQSPKVHQDSLLFQKFASNRPEFWRHQNWKDQVGPVFKFKKTLPIVTLSGRRDEQTGLDSVAHPATITMDVEGKTLTSNDSVGIYDPFYVESSTFQNLSDTARRSVPFTPAYGIPAVAPSGTLLGVDPQAYGGVFLKQNGFPLVPGIPNYALRAYQTHAWPLAGHWLDTIPYFGEYSFLEWHKGDVNDPISIILERAFPVVFNIDYETYTALYKQHNFALTSPYTIDTGYSYNNQRKLWYLGRDDSNKAWYRNVFSSLGRIYTAVGWHTGASGSLNGWMNWLPEKLVTEWSDSTACYPALAVHQDTLDADTSVSYVYQQNDEYGVPHVYRTTIVDGNRIQEMVSDSLGDHLQAESTPVVAPLDVYAGTSLVGQWDIIAYAIEPSGTQNGAIVVRVMKKYDGITVPSWRSSRLYFGGDSAHWPTIWASDSAWDSIRGAKPLGVTHYHDFPVYLAWQDTTEPLYRPSYLPNRYDDIYARRLLVSFDDLADPPLFDTTDGVQNVSLLADTMSFDNRRPCISGIRSGNKDTMTIMISYETNTDPNMLLHTPKQKEGVGVAYIRPPVTTSWQRSIYFPATWDPYTPHSVGDTVLFLKPSITVTRYTDPGAWWLPTVYYYSLGFEARNNSEINVWHFSLDNSAQRDTFAWFHHLRNPQIAVAVQGRDSDMEREALNDASGDTRWMIHQNAFLFKLPDIDHDLLYDYRSATLFDTVTRLSVVQGIGEFQTDDNLDKHWVDVVRREDNEVIDASHSPDYFLATDDFGLPPHGTLTYSPWAYTSSDSLFADSHERLLFRLDFYDSTDQFMRTLDSIWLCDTQPHLEPAARVLTFNGGGNEYGHVKFTCVNSPFKNYGSVQKIISPKRMSAFKESTHFAKGTADSLQLHVLQNPVKDYADISFSLPGTRAVSLNILDIGGREITDLGAEEVFRKGEHTIRWKPAPELPSGIYTVVLRFAGMVSSTQIAYVK